MPAQGSENFRPFRWKKPQEEAAALLAADELTDEEIGRRVGVSDRQMRTWKKHPEFAARIEELAREMGEVARRYAITRRARRLKGYDDRRERMLKLIEARAAEHAGAPGGATGLLVMTTKSVGSGPGAQVVDEYAVDAALLKELRELEKQAAVEAGQWSEKAQVDLTSKGQRLPLGFLQFGDREAPPHDDDDGAEPTAD